MKRFLELAAKYLVPVIIHYEIDNESFSALKRMLEYGRSTTIILAHGDRADPPTLRAILDEHPNVYCNLGGHDLLRWLWEDFRRERIVDSKESY